MGLNLGRRLVTAYRMFRHQLKYLAESRSHMEVCETRGPVICGVYFPLGFIRRYCQCGYMQEEKR